MSVYTVVDATDLEAFLESYSVGELKSFEGISAGIENTNYFVDTECDGKVHRFVLTIFEHHTFEELPYFLDIMAFMAEHSIPTAHPMVTKKGTYLQSLQGKPAALVQRLSGSGVEVPTVKQCSVMGHHLAKFHRAGESFAGTRRNDRGIDWMEQTFELIKSHLPADEIALIEDEISYQQSQNWAELPKGVVHADLFCDNALFDGDELTGIIDLYYACNTSLLYDLAVMANDWCRIEDDKGVVSYDQDKLESMLFAYQTVRPLNNEELALWRAALRLGGLRFFLSRLKDKHLPREGELTQIKDPNVFKQVLKYHRTYG